jgi:O-6-methylguanine DNA methyltransferase
MKNPIVELPVATPEGRFRARYTAKGLAELDFPGKRPSSRARPAAGVPAQIRAWHRLTRTALKSLLAGTRPEKFPPLAMTGTGFQRAVWRQLLKISPGRTKSYGQIAKAIGKPGAVRAVGGACGANPIPVLVPCHRVLAANRKIGGFSGGLHWKRSLLAREGVKL